MLPDWFVGFVGFCLFMCYPYIHTMMTSSTGNISALLAICAGNSPLPGEFPVQSPVTQSCVFFDLRPNIWWNKQSKGWWFETLSSSLWRHCNAYRYPLAKIKWNSMREDAYQEYRWLDRICRFIKWLTIKYICLDMTGSPRAQNHNLTSTFRARLVTVTHFRLNYNNCNQPIL